jgi:diguanylate cyclase (GGDEF)-like protein
MTTKKTTKPKRAGTKSKAKRATPPPPPPGKKKAASKKRGSTKSDKTASKPAPKKRGSTKSDKKASKPAPTKRASTKSSKTANKPAPKKRASTKTVKSPPPRPVAPELSTVVAVYESGQTNRRLGREAVKGLGYKLVNHAEVNPLVIRIGGRVPPDIVIAGFPGGNKIADAVMAVDLRARPVFIASLNGPAETAVTRCEEVGADGFVLRPHSVDSLAGALRCATQLGIERRKVAALEGTEESLRERLQRYGQADAATGFQHFDFFKQLLVMELKRAKRYGYSLAACLVALDPLDESASSMVTNKLRTRVAAAVASCLRDIDLPVDFADDRFLAFLPYTDIAGAEQVGKRISAAVRSFGTLTDGSSTYRMSVSVGIAALKKGKPVSFAKLMRDAGAAVRAAQLKGGGRVVVRS